MIELIFMLAGFCAALVAGVFLGFSDFVMRGLAQAPDAQGAAGMVGLNRTVYRSVFMVLLMGIALAALAIAVVSLWQFSGAARVVSLLGSAAYLWGVMLITAAGNVPMNTRLDSMSDHPAQTAIYWPVYVRRWTLLNHVRTFAAVWAAASWLAVSQMI